MLDKLSQRAAIDIYGISSRGSTSADAHHLDSWAAVAGSSRSTPCSHTNPSCASMETSLGLQLSPSGTGIGKLASTFPRYTPGVGTLLSCDVLQDWIGSWLNPKGKCRFNS